MILFGCEILSSSENKQVVEWLDAWRSSFPGISLNIISNAHNTSVKFVQQLFDLGSEYNHERVRRIA